MKNVLCCFMLLSSICFNKMAAYAQVDYSGVTIKTANSNDNKSVYTNTENERIINDTELSYSDGWTFDRLLPRNMGYFCNTRSLSKQVGATVAYRFAGCEGIILHAKPTEAGSSAEIYIDNTLIKQIDCSAGNTGGIIFDSGMLTRGEHTIKIVVTSGTVEIDYLICRGKVPDKSWIDCKNTSFLYYTAGFKFTVDQQQQAYSATADKEGEELELYCKGPHVAGYGAKGRDGGLMRLFVDGVKWKDIDFNAKQPNDNALLFELTNLPTDRFVQIRGKVISDKGKVTINGFSVNNPACLMVEMNRQTDEVIEKMKKHETTASMPEEWNPVKLSVHPPHNHISLNDSVFRTLFNRNINYLQESLSRPNWVDFKDNDRIWIDMLYGSNEGRMLVGMSNTLRYKEIPEFRKAIEDILETIDRRQFASGNGYMMPYESSNYNISKDTWPGIMRDEQKNYDRAMLTKGMLAAGEAGYDKAYQSLRKFYDWFNHADEYLPNMLLGSMGIQGSVAGPMVYHSPVGKPDDIQTNMKYYDMDWWLDALAQGLPEAAWRFTLNRPHNYLLTSICALFDIYIATGEQRYLNACLGGWKIYSEYFQTPGGGISLCEHFEVRPKTYLLTNLPNNIYETCGNVFWIDLNHRLLQLYPEKEIYASEIEQSLFNIAFAAQGPDGRIRYFNQMNDSKYEPLRCNTCCEIQATGLYSKLPEYLYSIADDGIYVNLYAQSNIDFEVNDQSVSLEMNTEFPYGTDVVVKVSCPSPVSMKLRLRVPSWISGDMNLQVNGKKIKNPAPGDYVTIERTWKNGDIVTFQLPKTINYIAYNGKTRIPEATRYAFTYGPILMALQGPMTEGCFQAENELSIRLNMSPETLVKNLIPSGTTCEFKIKGADNYKLVPYFSLQEGKFTCFPGMDKSK